MAIEGGMSCVKYLLFTFNLLFAITGLIIVIVGAKAEINAYPYVNLTDESFYTSAPIILIIVGLIVFIVAFFGCCGAVKENHCMIVTFSVFLLLIFIAELAVGTAAYLKQVDLETPIVKSLNESLKQYPTDADIKKSFDIIQTDLHCCGITSPDDWANNGLPIPATCCAAQELLDGKPVACTKDSSNFHTLGCLDNILLNMKYITSVLCGVGMGIAFVQLFGVIFACSLARSIRNQYETV